jgi:hypothetical protein
MATPEERSQQFQKELEKIQRLTQERIAMLEREKNYVENIFNVRKQQALTEEIINEQKNLQNQKEQLSIKYGQEENKEIQKQLTTEKKILNVTQKRLNTEKALLDVVSQVCKGIMSQKNFLMAADAAIKSDFYICRRNWSFKITK